LLENLAHQDWIALVLGNSRSHYAHFYRDQLQRTWHTPWLTPQQSLERIPLLAKTPIYIASVVPEQTLLWQDQLSAHLVTLSDIPLKNLYPTLGIDRALALLGLLGNYGKSGLVIDAGTAITLTGINQKSEIIGGAILPGLRLQFDSLNSKTASLPLVELPDNLPPIWANNTTQAIQSGIVHSTIGGLKGFIEQWNQQFPASSILITGGDGYYLYQYLNKNITTSIIYEENLVFLGFRDLFFGRE